LVTDIITQSPCLFLPPLEIYIWIDLIQYFTLRS
jgi:hypothetical protein